MKTVAPETLVEALHRLRTETRRGYTFLDRKLAPQTLSFAVLVAEAERRGAALARLGLEPGDRLALILPDAQEFVLTFLGAVLAGIIPVPLYPPVSLARAAAYLETTRGILAASGARFLVTSSEARPFAGQLLGPGSPLEAVLTPAELADCSDVLRTPVPSPSQPCFLQYTSGSTSAPKGVVVTHANIVANGLAIMRDGLAADPERDRGLSWLPLYHDMGLVGFVLAPLLVGVSVVFVPTLAFVKEPALWLRLVSEYRATITFGPNFAYGLCTKRGKQEQPLDLSCLRVLGCGAEPINPELMHAFLKQHEPYGLKANALIGCYGMAEATLAISFEQLDEPFRTARIATVDYLEQGRARPLAPHEAGEATPVTVLASCGRSFPGHELRIADSGGRPLPDGQVGEVLFRGPSATLGYFRDEAASQALLRAGWLHTGDLGFLLDGRLYVSGRKKDLLIVNGRNYYPQAVEWEVEQLEDVRIGTAVAFASSIEGSERPVVVLEARPGADVARLRQAVKRRLAETLGLAVDHTLIVKQSTVPRTTSGKVQRSKARALFEAGALVTLEDKAGASPRASGSLHQIVGAAIPEPARLTRVS